MDIKGFAPEEAQRLLRAAHMTRPDDPRLSVGDDAIERLGALRHLVLLLEANIGSQNLGIRLFEKIGEVEAGKALSCVEAIDLLERWAADPGGAGMSIEQAVDATLRKAGAGL